MKFKTSANGINLIKQFEGCRLVAYKPVATEKYWTIGYGHYGADVKQGMKITQAQADAYLVKDIEKFESSVNGYNLSWMDQNKFDALVSFTYNCGAGNLKSLLNSGKRSASEVSSHISAYNKGGGKVLNGLVKRRAAEKALFDKNVSDVKVNSANLSYKSSLVNRYMVKKATSLYSDADSKSKKVRNLAKGEIVQCFGYYKGIYAFVKIGNEVGFIDGNNVVKVL